MAVEEKSKAAEDDLKEWFTPISLDELLSKKFPKSRWVVEKLIPHEEITIISGAPASYKTWILLKMAIAISQGISLFEQFKCEQNNVLIIDEENHIRLLSERMKILGAGNNLNIHIMSQKGFLVSNKETFEIIIGICKERNIGIVFIDSLVRINDADENSASEMKKVFREVKNFCLNGITVVITHHERKEGAFKSSPGNRMRGSSDISASVDCHLSIKRDGNNKSKVLIEQAKLRADIEMDPFELEARESNGKVDFVYLGACPEKTSQKKQAVEAVKSILEGEKDGMSVGEIKKKIKKQHGIGDRSTANAIKELVAKKVLTEEKGIGNTKICRLNRAPQVVVQKTLI